MITNPDDYAFVDFSGGLPTGRFGGDIMPLRRAKCLPMAEDVAFLAECVRDKLGAFRGITQNGVPIDDADPGGFTPTWKFRASQMESLRTTLSYALSGANFHRYEPDGRSRFVGVGLLGQQPLPSGNTFLEQAERESSDETLEACMRDVLYPRYGLNASPSISRFARGDVPLESWVLHMYDDAKKLTRPVIMVENRLESILTVSRGSTDRPPSPTQSGLLGWSMVNNPGVLQYEGHVEWTTPNGQTQTIAVIPDSFISGADAWLVYDAYNSVFWRDGGGNTIRRRTGMIRLADIEDSRLIFYHSDQLGAHFLYAFNSPTGGARALFERIVRELGWTLYDLDNRDGVWQQNLTVTFSSRFIITGTPNGRTKWWD